MQQKTLTTIGRLRRGDRFYFLCDIKKKQVYQLDSFSGDKAIYVKVINDIASDSWMHERSTGQNKEVMFLRHTLLQPGDQCVLQDLMPGDILYKPEAVNNKYIITAKAPHEIKMAFEKRPQGQPVYGHPLASVILVKKAVNPKMN